MNTALTFQTFRYEIPGEPDIVWNIDRARELVRDQANVAATVPIREPDAREIAESNSWEEAHLANVDPNEPGIGAPILYKGMISYVLIDGQHRNVRALREGRTFTARLLTDEASRACVILGDDHPRMPWNLMQGAPRRGVV